MSDPSSQLIARLESDGEATLAAFFSEQQERLWRLVNFRMDRRLQGRVDADDVLQEAYLDAVQRLRHFLGEKKMSLFVWVRLIVKQTLANVHRRHLGTGMRDAARERSLGTQMSSPATSASLAARLLGNLTSPSQAALKAELGVVLESALDNMETIDQEVLALRHFEELTNSETAEVLGIQPKAASIRYIRALRRLKDVLARVPGYFDEDVSRD